MTRRKQIVLAVVLFVAGCFAYGAAEWNNQTGTFDSWNVVGLLCIAGSVMLFNWPWVRRKMREAAERNRRVN